jgi:phosphatidylserine synthase
MYILDGGPDNQLIAAQLILAGMLFDGLDGIAARALDTVHEQGVKLDAICDVITFCFAPGFLLYSVYYDSNYTSFQSIDNAFVVAAVLLICGLGTLRLARPGNDDISTKHFEGLPTSYTAYVSIGFVFSVNDPMLAAMVIGIFSLLMYSRVRFYKPTGLLILIFMLFVLAMFWLLSGWAADPNRYLLQLLLLASGIYLLSPLVIGVGRGSKHAR